MLMKKVFVKQVDSKMRGYRDVFQKLIFYFQNFTF